MRRESAERIQPQDSRPRTKGKEEEEAVLQAVP